MINGLSTLLLIDYVARWFDMRFLHSEDSSRELTYEDVFLTPQYSEVASRMDVDLTPVDGIGMTIPIVVANMNAVAGRRMAETVTRRGGLVVLPQDMSLYRLRQVIEYLKECHPVFETPVVLSQYQSIQTALNLIYKRAHGAIVVVDDESRPVGIFTDRDARDRDRFTQLKDAMSSDMITLADTLSPEEIFSELRKRRISVVPIIKSSGALAGVVTTKGAVRSTIYTPARSQSGSFLTGVALGINSQLPERIRSCVDMGIDVLVLDTAHGHQRRMLDAIRETRRIVGSKGIIVAGNVVTESATRSFIDAGASIVKVGVGPGAMCTTRICTGMGRPQFSAVAACSRVAREMGANVWADGGIRYPRDVGLAIAAGASSAMFGSWWAGTYESPADIQRDTEGRLFKENFGMASSRAVNDRTREQDEFASARKKYFEEGISHSKMYLKEEESSAEDIIDKITAGLRSTCTYAGARNLEELYRNAVVGVQTQAGYKEGKPVSERW